MQVRRRGSSRELRIDGTFASFYRTGREATGSVWDALAAPLLLLPPARRRRILILGLGGGSVGRLARALALKARIVGVERDASVIRAARRDFGVDALGLEIVQGDAFEYLRRARGSFDLVVEDLFQGRGRDLRKPSWLPEPGLGLCTRRLAVGGLLVVNSLDDAPETARSLRDLLPGLLRIDVEGYDNRVFVAASAFLSGRVLRSAVTAEPLLQGVLPKLRFRRLADGGRRSPVRGERGSAARSR